MRSNKSNFSINYIVNQINKLLKEPIYLTIKFIFPKFYRIDDIEEDQDYKFINKDRSSIIVYKY